MVDILSHDIAMLLSNIKAAVLVLRPHGPIARLINGLLKGTLFSILA